EVPTDVQSALYLEFRRLLDRAVRWFLQRRPSELDVGSEIDRFGRAVGELTPRLPELLGSRAREQVDARVAALVADGVPREPATTAATLVERFSLLDVVELAGDMPLERVARARYAVEEHLGIDRLLLRVRDLPREERWDSLARGALREDLHGVLNDLTRAVLATSDGGGPETYLPAWDAANPHALTRIREVLAELEETDDVSLASL